MVHEIFVAELSLVLIMVVNTIPRFEADEWGVLAVGSPYAYTRCVELYRNNGAGILRVEYLDGVKLTVVDDDGIVLECLLVEGQQSAFECRQRIAVVGDAAFVVAVDAVNLVGVVEAQHALDRFALADTRQIESRMCANLEVHLTGVSIVYMPYYVYLIVHQLVGYREHEAVGILAQCVLGLVQYIGDAVVGLSQNLEVHVACKSVTAQLVSLAIGAIGAFPQSAYYREEYWRASAPILVVALPKIFLFVSILDALKFGTKVGYFNCQIFVL